MIEYAYYNSNKIDFPLNENIIIINDPEKVKENIMISNSKKLKAQSYAPEIDFYIKNTQDNIADKIKNVEILYSIRGIKMDYATDFIKNKDIGNKLLIVGQKEQILQIEPFFSDDEFDLYFATSESVNDIEGTIGELIVKLTRNGKTTSLAVDQTIWFDAKKIAFKQNGVFDPNIDGIDEVVKKIKSNIDSFFYKKSIKYNPDICQYKGRITQDGKDICGDCANICPTNAIIKINEKKELSFTSEDCEGCGGCVSVCPSGALDLSSTPREYIYEASKLIKGKIILIVPDVLQLENISVKLPKNVFPFIVGGRKFLHEAHFLTLFQHSGHQVVFWTDFVSKGTESALDMVNEIGRRKFNKNLILVAKTPEELKEKLNKVEKIEGSEYSINEIGLKKREIFAARLSRLIGEDDLGVYENENEYIHYGKVLINETDCTLCLSCVSVCNVGALTAHPEDNTLRFNASVCTDCGYCEMICPEKCMSVVKDKFELKKDSFKQIIMAKDELFKCVECGKEFAPKKAVMKIAQMMAPRFEGNEAKIRTLYCCENCKAKVMLEAENKNKRILNDK